MATSTLQATSVFQNAEGRKKLAAANTKFALNLYKRLAVGNTRNLFVSPLSVSAALAMTYLGARENTKGQMSATMQFGDLDAVELGRTFGDIQMSLLADNKPLAMCMANKLFGERKNKFISEFQSLSLQFYGAELEAVDFRGDRNKAAAVINNFVADVTKHMIKGIISADNITDHTQLILINAIYFKGKWQIPFCTTETAEVDFHITPTEKQKVHTMFMKEASFMYGHSDRRLRCQVLELPYVGGQLSMFIFLPDSLHGLSDVEKALTFDVLADIHCAFCMQSTEVALWLPKFQLTNRIELSQVLAEMGMGDLFAAGRADLSGIDGTKELFVNNMLHRAIVLVDEEGTEASAATAMTVSDSMPVRNPPNFRADHPFLFLIYDHASGSVVFIGRVTYPR